ncbi:hypothetical protein AAFF_G00210840 [Aldrovandia affinis]|uniref:Uncharacterized protein n=1 Tax=Aldrovandia affinis TaxID=143900 RepID=A0AAD7SXD1_9TELE|nr:hypothetical protein AAFF_G00210840 [Aldrovandia affinis]
MVHCEDPTLAHSLSPVTVVLMREADVPQATERMCEMELHDNIEWLRSLWQYGQNGSFILFDGPLSSEDMRWLQCRTATGTKAQGLGLVAPCRIGPERCTILTARNTSIDRQGG